MTETARKRRRPFIVNSEGAFKALPHWLQDQGANSMTYCDQRTINVWHSKGRQHKPVGYILVRHVRFFDRTIETIQRTYGQAQRAHAKG